MAAKVTTREILFVRGNANIPPRVHRIPLTKKTDRVVDDFELVIEADGTYVARYYPIIKPWMQFLLY